MIRHIKYILFSSALLICSDLTLAQNNKNGGNKNNKQKQASPTILERSGKITDALGNPLVGVKVIANEGSTNVVTGDDGSFKVNVNANSTNILTQLEGYEPRIIDIRFLDNSIVLEKVNLLSSSNLIPMPFGELESRRITGAVTRLDSESIQDVDRTQNVIGIINGRVPGMFSSRDLRGYGNALVVIDGIPRSVDNSSDRLNLADNLTLQEIESVTVLKDAGSKMLYGAQANQGVILVTTKRGKPYRRDLSFLAESGIGSPISYPKYLPAAEYMTLFNEALVNDNLAPRFTQEQIDNTASGINPIRYPDESFFNSTYLKDFSSFYRFMGDASGGNDKARYYANLGYNRNGSLLKSLDTEKNANFNDRLNFRGNVDYTLNSFVSASLDAIAIFNNDNSPQGNFWQSAATQLPNSFPTLIPISAVNNSDLLSSAYIIDGKFILGGTNQFQNNIYGTIARGGTQQTQEKTAQFNLGLKFNLKGITKGLSAKTYGTYDFLNSFILRQTNNYAVYEPVYNANNELTLNKYNIDKKSDNFAINDSYFQRRFGFFGTLDYQREFNDLHNIDATALAYMSQYNTGLPAAASNAIDKNQHFGLRVNYMYNRKYIADFTGVYVGSGYFSRDNRYAFSPSLGLAYIISEENFIKNIKQINYLKIKANVGLMNTDANFGQTFLYKSSLSRGANFVYNQAAGNGNNITSFNTIGNPNLTFAKQKELNIGLEAALFNNSLNVEANYFDVSLYDLPAARNNAYTSYLGGFFPIENFGAENTSGVEVGANYIKKLGGLKLDVGFNMAYSYSKITEIDEPNYNDTYRIRKGGASDAMFGLIAEGLFKDLTDIASHAVQTFGAVKPGDIKYRDLNKDGLIDDNDLSPIGNSSPSYNFGLTLNLHYKAFNLFALGTAQTGYSRYLNGEYFWINGANSKYSEVARNRWTPQTAETATYPRLSSINNSNNFRNSTYWIRNNNFFNLNIVQLGYDLPGKGFYKGIQLYARASNLLTLSDIKEERLLNVGSAPQSRFFTLGLVSTF